MENGEKKRGIINSLIQFLKFNVVGIANTAVDLLIYTLLTALGLNMYIAQAVGYVCGMVNSYIWNSRWTFREERRRDAREILLFVAVNLVSLGVGEGVLYIAKNVLGVDSEILCKLISLPFSIGVNFIGNKLFVFRKKTPAASEEPAQGRDGAQQ